MKTKDVIIWIILGVIGIVIGGLLMYLFRPEPPTVVGPDIDAIRKAQYVEDSIRFSVFIKNNDLTLDSLNNIIEEQKSTNAYLWRIFRDEEANIINLPADSLVEFVAGFSACPPTR